jgi:hypothetical protein
LAGNNPAEAERNFFRPLLDALSCVTTVGLQFPDWIDQPQRALLLNRGQPVELLGDRGLGLMATIWYRIIEVDGPLGPWKTSTSAWYYELVRPDDSRLIAYHWHPSAQGAALAPHLHIGDPDDPPENVAGLQGSMLPTGRIALEQVLRLAIEEFDVEPLRDDWREVLDQTESDFVRHRTWT